MKETNYWKQFMMTGSVEDYLHYRSFAKEQPCNVVKDDAITGEYDLSGEKHAGLRGDNRDCVKDSSDR